MNKVIINNYDFFYNDANDPVIDHLKHGVLYGKNNYDIGMFYTKNKEGYIIDCGAHIGTFGFVPSLENKPILMIEAADKNVECLQSTFKPFNNTIIEHQVILDAEQSCEFSTDTGPFGSVSNATAGERKSTTIDHLCEKHSIHNVGLIKYDIEGYEIEAVLGSKTILARDKPVLILEINGHCLRLRNKKPYNILDVLEKSNYCNFLINQDRSLISINKQSKFPFCVMDIVSIHRDNLFLYLEDTVFVPPINNATIDDLILKNKMASNDDCKQYFDTL